MNFGAIIDAILTNGFLAWLLGGLGDWAREFIEQFLGG